MGLVKNHHSTGREQGPSPVLRAEYISQYKVVVGNLKVINKGLRFADKATVSADREQRAVQMAAFHIDTGFHIVR